MQHSRSLYDLFTYISFDLCVSGSVNGDSLLIPSTSSDTQNPSSSPGDDFDVLESVKSTSNEVVVIYGSTKTEQDDDDEQVQAVPKVSHPPKNLPGLPTFTVGRDDGGRSPLCE